jgi:hypothetical protein
MVVPHPLASAAIDAAARISTAMKTVELFRFRDFNVARFINMSPLRYPRK